MCSQSQVRAEGRSPVKTLWAGLRGRKHREGNKAQRREEVTRAWRLFPPRPCCRSTEGSYHGSAEPVACVSPAQTPGERGRKAPWARWRPKATGSQPRTAGAVLSARARPPPPGSWGADRPVPRDGRSLGSAPTLVGVTEVTRKREAPESLRTNGVCSKTFSQTPTAPAEGMEKQQLLLRTLFIQFTGIYKTIKKAPPF